MDKKTTIILNKYIDLLISKKIDIRNAYLFGSYAKNKQYSESDIDIAIIVGKEIDKIDFQTQLLLLAYEIDTRIEPHPFYIDDFNENNPFAREIKKTGINLINK